MNLAVTRHAARLHSSCLFFAFHFHNTAIDALIPLRCNGRMGAPLCCARMAVHQGPRVTKLLSEEHGVARSGGAERHESESEQGMSH